MTIVDVYKSQWKWRSWPTVFDALPDVSGSTILDLGCGIGDQTAELVARARRMPNAVFTRADLRALPDPGVLADGLWCSFTGAYFTDLASVLPQWCKYLRQRAWVALTEVDDLFGHDPLSNRAKNAFRGYRRQALAAERYDFRMGRRLRECAEQAGLVVVSSFTVPDAELSFDGAASPEVVLAWRNRLDGMKLLQDFCGDDFAKVCCVVATTPDAAGHAHEARERSKSG